MTEKSSRLIRKRLVSLAAAAVLLVSLGAAAYAGGFIESLTAKLFPAESASETTVYAWSDGSISTEKPIMTDNSGNAIALPDMERVNTDAGEVERLVGEHLASAEGSVTVDGNTFTLDSFLIDENGMGVLTFTLSNPDGVCYLEGGYGSVGFQAGTEEKPDGLCEQFFTSGSEDGSLVDSSTFLAAASDDGTSLKLVTYFGCFDGKYAPGDSLYWHIPYYDKGEYCEGASICFTPVSFAPSRLFSDEQGNELTLSAVGLSIKWQRENELLLDEVTLSLADGEKYVVESESDMLMNFVLSYWQSWQKGEFGSLNMLFNRLVDLDKVENVQVSGHAGDGKGGYVVVSFTCTP